MQAFLRKGSGLRPGLSLSLSVIRSSFPGCEGANFSTDLSSPDGHHFGKGDKSTALPSRRRVRLGVRRRRVNVHGHSSPRRTLTKVSLCSLAGLPRVTGLGPSRVRIGRSGRLGGVVRVDIALLLGRWILKNPDRFYYPQPSIRSQPPRADRRLPGRFTGPKISTHPACNKIVELCPAGQKDRTCHLERAEPSYSPGIKRGG